MSAAEPPTLPRELVLASAGSGKTFRISSRILGLLAAGAPPEEVFASTFTRKAAGEILGRVLDRLAAAALGPAEAERLSQSALLLPGAALRREAWQDVLERLVRALHRLSIGTLDAFFIRAAGAFGNETELPHGWRIVDDAVFQHVRADALDEVLRASDRDELLALLQAINVGDAKRSVHQALIDRADRLVEIHHRLDPDAPDPWGALGRALAGLEPPDDDERRRLATGLRETPAPREHGGWRGWLDHAAAAIEAEDWRGLLGNSLVQKLLCGETAFHRIPIEPPLEPLLRRALDLARRALAPRLAAQARALGVLAARLAEAYRERQQAAAAYRFDDVTRLLGRQLWERPDVHYRLDARLRHLLLDEFQDTSLPQWEVLEPLLEELLAGHERERAAIVVADPKQSIYGWRGGEPLLVDHVGGLPGMLKAPPLARSWRSSQVVLDVVNRVFTGIASNYALLRDPSDAATLGEWARAYTAHEAAKTLPGHVRLLVGPRGQERDGVRPELCRCAAELVAELHEQAPGQTIGVLTRTNAAVAQMIYELKRLGIQPSEEGGNPLSDSAAVCAVLALLRAADHPGDTISRYHVAVSPLGPAVGFTDWTDHDAAARLAHETRRELLEEGYGRTLERLAARLEPACDDRDRRRLQQLAERGYRFDAEATLRPTDFVRMVVAERVEDPLASNVRVMTIHQAKGLEFDAVVLPQLDASRGGGEGAPLTYRARRIGRVTAVFPPMNTALRQLFADVPELREAQAQHAAGQLRDTVSALYVGLTRARHALHLVVAADGRSRSGSRSLARVLREALAPGRRAVEGEILFEAGDPDWHRRLPPAPEVRASAPRPRHVRLASAAGRTRMLPRQTPSTLEGGARVDLGLLLRLDTLPVMRGGRVAHAWFEALEWLEDGVPADAELRRIARETAPEAGDAEIAALLPRFRAWLAQPAVRRALSRESYPIATTVEREVPFVHRAGGTLMEGVIDRLLLVRDFGGLARAEILDFKTDALDGSDRAALQERIDHYRPQLRAYRDAVAAIYRLDPARVTARLVMLEAGEVVKV